MMTLRTPALAFLGLLLAAPALHARQAGEADIPSESAIRSEAAAQSVQAATREWIATFNTRDAARISALYAPDAILWGTVSKTIRTTPEEILEYFTESATKRPKLQMVLGEHIVRVFGDIATTSGYYSSRNPVDGQEVVVPMRFTFMYRRDGDRWMIVNHHSSRFAPTP